MTRFLPTSLTGQLMLALLTALVAAQVTAFVILADEHRMGLETAKQDQVLGRTASIVRVLAETPTDSYDRVLRAASTRQLQFKLDTASRVDPTDRNNARNRFSRRLRRLLELPASSAILVQVEQQNRWNWDSDDDRDEHDDDDHWQGGDDDDHWHMRQTTIIMALELGDGQWLNATYTVARPPQPWAHATFLILGLTGLAVCIVAFFMVRRITNPLANLARAAEALGRGETGPDLLECGSDEVRQTTKAFNQMRDRLNRFVDDRTRMLAAISHDLRTPLTTLRLRAELLADSEHKQKILDSLDEMQRMTEATLAFARDDAAVEETRAADLGSMIESIALDLGDMGYTARFDDPGAASYACRPVALKRALRNLMENAVRYGGEATATLSHVTPTDDVVIIIDDRGPGIPHDRLESVFDPFYRLEESRSHETGGIGLGLAIARTIVQAHGGTIELTNRDQSGLCATVILPANSDQKHK
jgi:signal transduction histidine kinase